MKKGRQKNKGRNAGKNPVYAGGACTDETKPAKKNTRS